jgi:hypothetical protein
MTKKILKPHALIDSCFYNLSSPHKLAELLFTSRDAMEAVLASEVLYKRKWKHKKEDKWLNADPTEDYADNYRPIDIPIPQLKAYQSRIAALLGRILPPNYLFSPVKGRSYVDNALQHKSSRAFWMLDIANYFPSCTANNVAWFFNKVMKCPKDITELLVRLTTLNGSLPQGSPCSPILAYYSNMNMWDDIHRLAKNSGCIVSVYADDITLSSSQFVSKKAVWAIKSRIKRQGLLVKQEKETSVIDRPARITGVIINDHRSLLPNKQHKELAALRRSFAIEKNAVERKKLKNRIAGRIAQKGQIEFLKAE